MRGGGSRHEQEARHRERFVRLTHGMMETQAWRSLDGNARAIYFELARLYRGNNNGRIGFSATAGGFRHSHFDVHCRARFDAVARARLHRRRRPKDVLTVNVRPRVGGSPSSTAMSPASRPVAISKPGVQSTALQLGPRGDRERRGIDG